MCMIQMKNVQKSFGKTKVLHDIHLSVPRSNVYSLIGPSGAGKSTLIRTINALESIQGGEILVDSVPCTIKKQTSTKCERTSGSCFNLLICTRI